VCRTFVCVIYLCVRRIFVCVREFVCVIYLRACELVCVLVPLRAKKDLGASFFRYSCVRERECVCVCHPLATSCTHTLSLSLTHTHTHAHTLSVRAHHFHVPSRHAGPHTASPAKIFIKK